jgi:N6-adenosine-specific RNA methylase IME4
VLAKACANDANGKFANRFKTALANHAIRKRNAERAARAERECPGTYDVLYCDAPYQDAGDGDPSNTRSTTAKYETQSNQWLCTLRVNGRLVRDLIAANGVLFYWASPAHRDNGDAHRVAKAFGFPDYQGEIVWDKMQLGKGGWIRNQHELLLVFTKGRVAAPTDAAFKSVYSFKRSPVHSQKAEEFLGLIIKATPNMRRLELFNRARAPNESGAFDAWGAPIGFDVWGNEAAKRPAGAELHGAKAA